MLKLLRANCMLSVEAPCVKSRSLMLRIVARAMPRMSTPLCSKNRASSRARNELTRNGGMSSRFTNFRPLPPGAVISFPSRS